MDVDIFLEAGQGRSYLRTKNHSHAPSPPPHAGLNGRQEAMQNTDGMADVSQPAILFATVWSLELKLELRRQDRSSPLLHDQAGYTIGASSSKSNVAVRGNCGLANNRAKMLRFPPPGGGGAILAYRGVNLGV